MKCKHCNEETGDGNEETGNGLRELYNHLCKEHTRLFLKFITNQSETSKKWLSWNCHDCEVKEGQLHKPGCDMEQCPNCLTQLISCDCSDETLKDLQKIPYILNPTLCKLCGEQWPEMFKVTDDEWSKYVIPPLQKHSLCLECYDELKTIFPDGWRHIKNANS